MCLCSGVTEPYSAWLESWPLMGELYPRGTEKYSGGAVWTNISPELDSVTGSRPREMTKLVGGIIF